MTKELSHAIEILNDAHVEYRPFFLSSTDTGLWPNLNTAVLWNLVEELQATPRASAEEVCVLRELRDALRTAVAARLNEALRVLSGSNHGRGFAFCLDVLNVSKDLADIGNAVDTRLERASWPVPPEDEGRRGGAIPGT